MRRSGRICGSAAAQAALHAEEPVRSLATEVLPLLGGEYWSLEACEKVRVLVFVCEALVMAPEVSAVMQRRIAELDAVYEVLETRKKGAGPDEKQLLANYDEAYQRVCGVCGKEEW